MDAAVSESLRSHDWKDIAARLLASAVVLATRYGWNLKSQLPRGQSLESVVAETISDIWDQPERLNPSVPLFVQLRGIVRSKLWNLSQSKDEDIARTEDLDSIPRVSVDAGRAVDTADEFRRAIELLLAAPKIKGNSELELVVTAMGCGCLEPAAIAEATCIDIQRVYQLVREIKAVYPYVATQLRPGESQS
jgi:hypothetical protein